MLYYGIKLLLSAGIIVVVSEMAKRSSLASSLLASLPLTSLLTFLWLYGETQDTERVAALAGNIFWLLLPSLVLFIALPWLLKLQVNFYLALALACLATVGAYGLMVLLLKHLGIAG